MNYSVFPPAEIRALIRAGKLDAPTTGCCDGYAQGNLVVLPKALAWDFLLFCQRNPKACPLLEVADAGERSFSQFAPGSDIAQDIPRYRIYRNGELTEETTDVVRYFEERSDLVSFLIGCSFSFESALLDADIPAPDRGRRQCADVQHQHSLHARGGVQRKYGRQYASDSPRAGACGGGHHGGHAPRARCAGADRHAGGHRHHRSGPP